MSIKVTVFYPGEHGSTSIRRVTEALVHSLPKDISIREYVMPGKDASLRSIIKNIVFVWNHRDRVGFNYLAIQSYAILGLIGTRKLITVHDLNPVYGYYGKQNKWYYKVLVYLGWIYLPVILTNRIACVSNYTKKQLNDHVSMKHVEVVYNLLHPTFNNLSHRELIRPTRFSILVVGTGKQKNVESVFKALQGLDVHLNVLGKLSIEQEELLTNIDYSAYSGLDDKSVCDLYLKSDIVVFASVSEGFGMPILEAQATGCALVCSNVEPMMEIAGEGALFVDPFNVCFMQKSIVHLMDDDELFKKLVSLGYENLKRFEPQKSVQNFLKLLQ